MLFNANYVSKKGNQRYVRWIKPNKGESGPLKNFQGIRPDHLKAILECDRDELMRVCTDSLNAVDPRQQPTSSDVAPPPLPGADKFHVCYAVDGAFKHHDGECSKDDVSQLIKQFGNILVCKVGQSDWKDPADYGIKAAADEPVAPPALPASAPTPPPTFETTSEKPATLNESEPKPRTESDDSSDGETLLDKIKAARKVG